MSDKDYNLGHILSKYDVVLPDSCTIINPFQIYGPQKILGQNRAAGKITRKQRAIAQGEYLEFLISLVEEGSPIYITEGVLGEIKNSSIHRLKKSMKKLKKEKRKKIPSTRYLEINQSLKDRLVSIVQNNNNVLTLTESEARAYEELQRQHDSLCKKCELHENDIELLMSGLAISEQRPCAILSNDTGILSAYHTITNRNNLSFNQLGFYMTMGTFSFKDPNRYFSKKKVMGW